MRVQRVQTGIVHEHDGWWVVQRFHTSDGKIEQRYYGPTSAAGGSYATEDEAWRASVQAAALTRSLVEDAGAA